MGTHLTLQPSVLTGLYSSVKLPSSQWPTQTLSTPREEEIHKARPIVLSSSDLSNMEATARRALETASFCDLSAAALRSYVMADQLDFDFD